MIELDIRYLRDAEIAKEAQRFLAKYKCLEKLPVPIEDIIEFDLNIDIVPLPNLQRDFEIEGFISPDLTTIYVDEFIYDNRVPRYRFTLAHEVGYFFLHKEIFDKFAFDPSNAVESWKSLIDQIDPNDYSKAEYQGYTFGGLVLVPQKHLERIFQEKLDAVTGLIDKAKSKGLNRESYLPYAIDRMASILSPLFEVSTDVLIRRIRFDKLETFFA